MLFFFLNSVKKTSAILVEMTKIVCGDWGIFQSKGMAHQEPKQLSSLLVVFLLPAVLLENFSLFYSSEEDALLSTKELKMFQAKWDIVDQARSVSDPSLCSCIPFLACNWFGKKKKKKKSLLNKTLIMRGQGDDPTWLVKLSLFIFFSVQQHKQEHTVSHMCSLVYYWACSHVLQKFSRVLMRISWDSHENLMRFSWKNGQQFSWECHELFHQISRESHEILIFTWKMERLLMRFSSFRELLMRYLMSFSWDSCEFFFHMKIWTFTPETLVRFSWVFYENFVRFSREFLDVFSWKSWIYIEMLVLNSHEILMRLCHSHKILIRLQCSHEILMRVW